MTGEEQRWAADLDDARRTVGEAGANALARRPWQRPRQPVSDADLVRFVAWACEDEDRVDPLVIAAGMRLLSSARAELDQVEAGLLFAARAVGLTWRDIASALGLDSAQAGQQRLSRVLDRLGGADTGA